MAELTKVNSSSYGVVHVDRSATGADGSISADETVIANGPQLNFFKIIVQNGSSEAVDMRNELGGADGSGGDAVESVEVILRTIQNKGNVEMYQVEGDATGQISVAVYPKGAWSASTLQTAIRALGTTVGANSVDVSGTAVTDGGFKLA